tara:strand:- start:354 stop:512 length:159 start_codon:yes stop_codon:yes gene_type:complete
MGAKLCISERDKICSSPRLKYKKTIREYKDNFVKKKFATINNKDRDKDRDKR